MDSSQHDRAFHARNVALSKTWTFTDVQEAADGGSGAVALSLGTPPHDSYLIGYQVRVPANWEGGSSSAVVGSIGTEEDPDQIAGTINLHTGTAGADRNRNGTAGIMPSGKGYGGVALFFTFTPTGGTGVPELDAGSVNVELLFAKGDRRTRL